MSSNLREIFRDQAKKNPSAVICIARAIAVALIIMFLTPNSCAIVNGDMGRDYVVIWSDDAETFTSVLRLARGFVPIWDFSEPVNSTEGTYSPFPVPQSVPRPEAGK